MGDGHMSDDFGDEYDDYSEHNEQPAGGGLRQFAERQKQENAELRRQLEEIQRERKQEKLADALKASGVSNPAALGDFAGSIDPEKATDFVSAVKAALGLGGEEAASGGVSEEVVAAQAAVSGEPAGTVPANQGDVVANLAAIDNEADFWATIRNA